MKKKKNKKKQNEKRVEQLATRVKNEAFHFHVMRKWEQFPDKTEEMEKTPLLEIENVCNQSLEKDLLTWISFVEDAAKYIAEQETDKGSLKNSPLAFILGITQEMPKKMRPKVHYAPRTWFCHYTSRFITTMR